MLYLASTSPRRKQLLGWFGLPFKIIDPAVNEADFRSEDGAMMVGELALKKAEAGQQKVKKGIVIGSDLTVVLPGRIIGKPKDLKEAKEFLLALSGKTHVIYCGVAVTDGKKTLMSVAESKVKMKKYNREVIDKYVKKFELLDKGGAYAIQFELPGYGSLVERFEGGITTIIGLPLEYLKNLLKEFEVKVDSNWRKKCKIETGYEN